MLTNDQGFCACLLRSVQELNTQPGSVAERTSFYPQPFAPVLQRSLRERELPEVETFLNKSFNFSPVDTAALTQSHV